MSPQHHFNPNAAPRRRRLRLPQARRDWVAGTLVELDPAGGTITVRVESGGPGAVPRGAELRFDASSARVRASDGDGNGRPGLTDLFPGDRVRVVLARGGMTADRVEQRSAGAPKGGLRPLWSSA